MILSSDNYYEHTEYMSVSQLKAFLECEAAAMAEIKGEWERPETDALLLGSYVDAYFEGTVDKFMEEHPEMFKRDGSLKAAYEKANDAIATAEADEMFMEYMSGEKQPIFTAGMFGTEWKIKIDSLCPDKIVDLKYMRSFERGYDSRRNFYADFITLWKYDWQLAVYQEIYRLATGKKLPVFIAGLTKQDPPDKGIFSIPQWRLDECLAEVERELPHVLDVKSGKVKPERCGVCAYCRATKKLTGPIEYSFAGMSEKERKEYDHDF